jgi:endo-1,4-beta-xylanase
MTLQKILYFLLLTCAISPACSDEQFGGMRTGNYTDTNGALKDEADFPIGIAIDYTPYLGDAAYRQTVKQEARSTTFGYQMKHGAIVKSDGSLDFSKADQLYDAATSDGLEVFGHTLAWHQNQNANYLKTYAGIVVAGSSELAANPGFEAGLANWSVFNTGNPAGTATITATTTGGEFRTGTGGMKVVNPTAYAGSQWRVQVSSAAFTTTPGTKYVLSYWVKAGTPGGSIRLSTGPSAAQYQGDQTIGTAWQQISWTITASLTSTTVLFDMGQAANTYFIDDVSIKEFVPDPSPTQVAAKLDQALNNFITGTVTHYKGKVKAWDVVNELLADNGALRSNSNTPAADDVLVWSNYMGQDYALKAFNYAAAADPDALLFINDYNLESSGAKLDSLIKTVGRLKARGAKIDGIGTQMHISINTSYAGIQSMFKKLADTGLKVRISELDVRLNPNDLSYLTADALFMSYQARMYEYVVQSYLENVPAAQRHGITIWGVTDQDSWIVVNQKKNDFPLLFNNRYEKKPAYSAVLQTLKANK